MITETEPVLMPTSTARPWLHCVAYLEQSCNPHFPEPYPLSTLLYCQLLWTLSEALGVRSVLEVGIGPHAVSGMIFAHSMGTRGGGLLYSIDVETDRPAQPYRQMALTQGVNWIVTHGESLTLASSLPPDLQVDLLYIDGDHDYAHAYGDTVAYMPFLRPGGYLVIDDYPGCDGVVEARIQLQQEGYTFLHASHHPPHNNGRLVMQKHLPATYRGREV